MRMSLKDYPSNAYTDSINRWQADLDEWTDTQRRANRDMVVMYICTLVIGLTLVKLDIARTRIWIFGLTASYLVGILHTWRLKRAEGYYRAVRALEELGK